MKGGLPRPHGAALIAVLLLGAALRLVRLGEPSGIVFDEVHYVPAARTMAGLAPHPGVGDWSFHPLIGRTPDPCWSHPPLGKMIIAAGMLVAGDHAVGWRITSAVAGVLSLLVVFLIARRLGLSPTGQVLAVFLLATDFLHIAQSRVAMLDGFLFLLGAIAFHGVLSYRDGGRPWTLAYVAIALGCALMVKESAVCVVAACMLLLAAPAARREAWPRRVTVAAAVGAGALGVYALSSLYFMAHGFTFADWVAFRREVVTKLVSPLAAHPYSSRPWQWLIGERAMWYSWTDLGQRVVGTVAFGNPPFWYAFLGAAAVLAWRAARRGPRSAPAVVLLWWIGLYVPLVLMLLGRVGFIYHYLPAVAVMAAAVPMAIDDARSRDRLALLIAAACLAALVAFLPVVLGLPMSRSWYAWIIRFTGT